VQIIQVRRADTEMECRPVAPILELLGLAEPREASGRADLTTAARA